MRNNQIRFYSNNVKLSDYINNKKVKKKVDKKGVNNVNTSSSSSTTDSSDNDKKIIRKYNNTYNTFLNKSVASFAFVGSVIIAIAKLTGKM